MDRFRGIDIRCSRGVGATDFVSSSVAFAIELHIKTVAIQSVPLRICTLHLYRHLIGDVNVTYIICAFQYNIGVDDNIVDIAFFIRVYYLDWEREVRSRRIGLITFLHRYDGRVLTFACRISQRPYACLIIFSQRQPRRVAFQLIGYGQTAARHSIQSNGFVCIRCLQTGEIAIIPTDRLLYLIGNGNIFRKVCVLVYCITCYVGRYRHRS